MSEISPSDILLPEQRRKSPAYLVNKLRKVVADWRSQGYPGVSPTTKRLLQFWFDEEHYLKNGEAFEFWFAQREAIETLIYLKEVLKNERFIELAEEFGEGPLAGYDPKEDKYANYAFKMATGSGKTFVMALAIVWSYFNAIYENKDFPTKFLIIAPNVIVYERLKRDFEDGKIFEEFPFIPPEFKPDWQIKFIMREDSISVIPENVIFLTNIQQLQERNKKKEEVEGIVDEILKMGEVKKTDIYQESRIKEILDKCPNIMILKDEAHHIYNREKAWKKILLQLHENLLRKHGKGIWAELDFSATPKTEQGHYFPWIIMDFPLSEAIEMNLVKRPIKGKLEGAREIASSKASHKYRLWIDAGIKRWRQYYKALKRLNKKPILFIMCENTKEADEVYEYVNSIPYLKGKVLLIHTNLQGEIAKKDLEKAREAARKIDSPEYPYHAIVSVMMLNEGWDVRNVCVIVGLRSYTSRRKVLPEQVIGRGLRKMFPDQPAKNFVNMLEVIGPKGLIEILNDLEAQEGIELAEFDVEKPLEFTTIYVISEKVERYNIKIPILSPRISKSNLNVSEIDIEKLPRHMFEIEKKEKFVIRYIGEDMLTEEKVIEEEWRLPVPKDSRSVIGFYISRILREAKYPISTNFQILYPIVKQYVKNYLFKEKVKLDDEVTLMVLSSPIIESFLIKTFKEEINKLSIAEEEPRIVDYFEVKDLKPFPWAKSVYEARKSVLNYQPIDNSLEEKFAKFLDRAKDVQSFIKLPEKKSPVYIEYISATNIIRHYYPDFIVKLTNGEHWIVETKGRVDLDTIRKDERAKQWCEDISKLTGEKWNYLRVDEKIMGEYDIESFDELKKLVYT